MEGLNVIDLYNKTNNSKLNSFSKDINSNLRVVTDIDKVECDYEWIDLMEETIPYIDNILRSPNRFIINEEDVIKVELAKKVTVESIKHLSKNTNLIEDFNKKTGDVRPSKILNITKEESYETYENRLIYSLIQNMKLFIEMRKEDLVAETSEKSDKTFEYTGSSSVGNEKIDINMTVNSKYLKKHREKNDEGLTLQDRLEKLNQDISMLTNSEVYKLIDKKHLSLITPPVKKTNLIMKNVNFQYAMKLWDYLRDNFDDKTVVTNEQKDYEDNGILKSLMDESFLIQYLIMKTLDDNDKEKQVTKKELEDVIMEQMIGKMIDMDINLTEDDLKKVVAKRFEVIKYKKLEITRQIQKIFEENIDKVREKIEG